jgi:hypothetical protein
MYIPLSDGIQNAVLKGSPKRSEEQQYTHMGVSQNKDRGLEPRRMCQMLEHDLEQHDPGGV